MKKFVTLALCIVMAASMVITASAAVNITAPKAAITLDGVRDDAYGEPTEIKALRGDIPGATATIWSAWDDNNVYYYAEVLDTTPNHDAADAYARDSVEFFFDWDNYKGDSNVNDDHPYWQIRAASAPNEDGVQFSGGLNGVWDNELTDFFEELGKNTVVKPLAGSDLNGGYIVEIALPAKSNGITLTEGKVIGVDFQVGDNQEGDGRTSQVFLEINDDTDSQWNNPAGCSGLLTLGAAAVVAPVETKDEPAEEAAPEAVQEPEAAPEPVAPATGDMTMILVVLCAAAGAGVCLMLRKRSNVR